MKKISRRDVFTIAAAAAIANAAEAQTPALAGATDWLAKSQADKRATADTLAKFPLEIGTEPAFHFKA